jgi:hypothetical protein
VDGDIIIYDFLNYIRYNKTECIAAATGIAGGFFVSSINANIRSIGFVLWALGNICWLFVARGDKRWAFFVMQIIYLGQNMFSLWNADAGLV